MNKKTLSLSRTLAEIILFGYSTLMILLVCMNCILIAQYQDKRRNEKAEIIEKQASAVMNDMDSMQKLLKEVFMNDSNYSRLAHTVAGNEQYTYAYDLRESLRGHMMLDEGLHGFFIVFQNGMYPLYQINQNMVSSEQSRKLCDVLKRMESQDEKGIQSGFILTIEDSVFWISSCHKGTVSLYGIYNLSHLQETIPFGNTSGIKLGIMDENRIYLNEALISETNLMEQCKTERGSFSYHYNGYYISSQKIHGTGLWLCCFIKNSFSDYLNLYQLLLLFLTGCSVLIAFVIYRFLRKNLMLPLGVILAEMNQIRGNHITSVPDKQFLFEELQEINETFAETVTKLEEQRLLTYDAVIEKQKAQMQYLQIQLQPHFYLNGLKTLNALIMEKQTSEAQTLILSLSEHLRYLLQIEEELVTLGQEMKFTKNYVDVRQQMTGRRITFLSEVPKEVEKYYIPLLTIQTFVENSIKYAKLGSFNISLVIRANVSLLSTEEGDFLDIVVSDNGQGYPEEVLELINGNPEAGDGCIGIQNLKRRCRILYGEKAEYMFCNQNGAVSEYIIPARDRK